MSNRKFILFFIIFFIIVSKSFAQIRNESLCQIVLKKQLVNKEFKYSKHTKEYGKEELYINLIGCIGNKKNKIYFITYTSVFGRANHAKSFVYLFNSNFKYIGNYSGFDIDELPYKVEKSKLFFTNKDTLCTALNKVFTIDFDNEIPHKITIKCNSDIVKLFYFKPA